jgi:hypothetical protein
MGKKKDHEVTIITRNGDTNKRMMTKDEARAAEQKTFDNASNVAYINVKPPRR